MDKSEVLDLKIKLAKSEKMCYDLNELLEEVYHTLLVPTGLRLKVLRWMFPEIVNIAKMLKNYYWRTYEKIIFDTEKKKLERSLDREMKKFKEKINETERNSCLW